MSATVHQLRPRVDLRKEDDDQPVTAPPGTGGARVAQIGRATSLVQGARKGAVPAARAVVVHGGYSAAGMWRLGGAGWRWVVATEFGKHIDTRPEMVREERKRRRAVAIGATLATAGAADWLIVYSWPLAVVAAVVVFVVAGVAERRIRASYAPADAGRKALGKHPGAKAVRRVVAAAKLGKEDLVRIVGPVVRDDDRAWTAVVEPPEGVTYQAAAKRQAELAAAIGVGISQVSVDPVKGNEGRFVLWVADADPLGGKSLPSGLVGRTTPFDVYGEKVLVGYDIRRRPVGFSLLERSLLIGGEPGSGKSVGSNNVLCSCALDPRMPLWLVDGKGGADLSDYEDVATRFLGDPDPKALLSMASDAQDDMSDRYRALKGAGEKKLTGEIAEDLGFHQVLFHIDELQFFMASKLGDEIVDALWDLVSRGRGAGWSLSAATQRPAADVVPTKLRDILSIRWALSCTTPQASNTILGEGYAARGFNAQLIDIEEQKGGGYLKSGATPVLMRTGMLTDAQIRQLCKRAYGLREQAGTLPKSDARPAVRLLKRVLGVLREGPKTPTAEILDALGDEWTGESLADALRPLGVRPDDLWVDGKSQRGYRRADVQRALDRA